MSPPKPTNAASTQASKINRGRLPLHDDIPGGKNAFYSDKYRRVALRSVFDVYVLSILRTQQTHLWTVFLFRCFKLGVWLPVTDQVVFWCEPPPAATSEIDMVRISRVLELLPPGGKPARGLKAGTHRNSSPSCSGEKEP